MNSHQELIGLIIAYTIAGAFVFTVAVTCLSLVGWIRFANRKQQQRLFQLLVVEIVVICVGFFSGFLQYNPSVPARRIGEQAVASFQGRRETAASVVKGLPQQQREALARALGLEGGDAALVNLMTVIARASSVSQFEVIASQIKAITGKDV